MSNLVTVIVIFILTSSLRDLNIFALNTEILKYDDAMKNFERTGKLRRAEDKRMREAENHDVGKDGELFKRDADDMDTPIDQHKENDSETVAEIQKRLEALKLRKMQAESNLNKLMKADKELTADQRKTVEELKKDIEAMKLENMEMESNLNFLIEDEAAIAEYARLEKLAYEAQESLKAFQEPGPGGELPDPKAMEALRNETIELYRRG